MKNKNSRRDFLKKSVLGVTAFSLPHNLVNKISDQTYNTNSFEWEFAKRPYTDEEASNLLSSVIDSETANWHYNVHKKDMSQRSIELNLICNLQIEQRQMVITVK